MGKNTVRYQEEPIVLSIVIVNSDGTVHTLGCLDSIFLHQPAVEYEVILVDNCSQDSCLQLIADTYPEVRVFSAPERQGFAKNYNLGIRQTRGDYIMVLNNDTVVHPGTFTKLLDALQSHKEYGMVGPQLRTPDWQLQAVCARDLPSPVDYVAWQLMLDPGMPAGQLVDWVNRQRVSQRPSGPVPCISGACMVTSREVLEDIGLLDEGYNFYFEDIEWCHRVVNNGLQVAYIAEAVVTHLGDQSLSKVKELAKQSEYLSAIRYYTQYHGLTLSQSWVLWMATLLGFFIRAAAYQLLGAFNGGTAYAAAYWRLTGWIIHRLPVRAGLPLVDMPGSLQLKVEEGE